MTDKKRETNIHGNVENLIQIEQANGNIIINSPSATAPELLEQGKKLLKDCTFSQAITLFEKAIEINPNLAEVYYYLAMAMLRGARPKLVSLSTIRRIEKLLKTASQLQPQMGGVYILWALVKFDYYVLNGMYDRPPTYQELLRKKRSISHTQTQEILSAIQAEGNDVWEWLKNRS